MAAVALIMSALTASAVLAAEILPSAYLLSFDSATFTYVYRVICPSDMTQPFGYFQVDAQVPELDPYVIEATQEWGLSGPFTPSYPNGEDLAWTNDVFPWNAEADSAYWRCGNYESIPPLTAWQGDFVLIVPNTQPSRGFIYTANGVPESHQELVDFVPCPIPDGGQPVPEPSSIIALAGGLGSVLAFRRRRK